MWSIISDHRFLYSDTALSSLIYLWQIIINSRRLGEEELEEIEEMVKEKEVGGMLSRLLGSTLEEGRIKGVVERARNDIYEILEARFGDVPEDIKEAVEKITDLKSSRFS